MSTPVECKDTLYDIRVARGLKHEDVVAKMAANTGAPQKHWTANAQYEQRGVRNIEVLEALAQVYDVDFCIIRAAARNSRDTGRPENVRRKKHLSAL